MRRYKNLILSFMISFVIGRVFWMWRKTPFSQFFILDGFQDCLELLCSKSPNFSVARFYFGLTTVEPEDQTEPDLNLILWHSAWWRCDSKAGAIVDSEIIRGNSYHFLTVPVKLWLFSNCCFWLVVFNLSKMQPLTDLCFHVTLSKNFWYCLLG